MNKGKQIHDLLMVMNNKLRNMEKMPMVIPDGIKLFMSEIHTLVVIYNCPGINVTDLALKLSVTRGQLLRSLKNC